MALVAIPSWICALASGGGLIWFFFGVRNQREHIHKAELEKLAAENENIHLHVAYSKPAENDVKGRDYHHEGRLGIELLKELLPLCRDTNSEVRRAALNVLVLIEHRTRKLHADPKSLKSCSACVLSRHTCPSAQPDCDNLRSCFAGRETSFTFSGSCSSCSSSG